MKPIDYSLIGRAVDFYKSLGYEYIEVPWMVEPLYAQVTYDSPAGIFSTYDADNMNKSLIGSAEQGFLEKIGRGEVYKDTKYVSVSPCFRRGDRYSPYHQETFMKVELSYFQEIGRGDPDMVTGMVADAGKCFIELGISGYSKDITPQSIDIIAPVDGAHEFDAWLEIGSYGTRDLTPMGFTGYQLCYGTGLALPRFQEIILRK